MLLAQQIVDEAVKSGNTKVTRPVAAFVTRMVAYRFGNGNGAENIRLDASIVDAVVSFVSGDFPSAMTVRMQASFESAYSKGHADVEARRRSRLRRMQELLDDILNLAAKVEATAQSQASSMSATGGRGEASSKDQTTAQIARLAEIHQKMCEYCVTYLSVDRASAGLPPDGEKSSAMPALAGSAPAPVAPAPPKTGPPSATQAETSTLAAASQQKQPIIEPGKTHIPLAVWEGAQKEISTALESVYPRLNTRQFASLPQQEVMAQLDEIAHLVLGIRLFNWSHGKGGLGINDTPAEAEKLGTRVLRELERTLTTCNERCQQYLDSLLALRCGAITATPTEATAWPSELANRRQLGVYCASLAEEVRSHLTALQETTSAMQLEMRELSSLLQSRTSLPKEVVYPRFHNVAARWLRCAEIRDAILTVSAAHDALGPHMPPAVCTLPLETLRASREAAEKGLVDSSLNPALLAWVAATNPNPKAGRRKSQGDGTSSGSGEGAGEMVDPDAPQRLSLEHSPEFLQLPLEFQGYCPVSLALPASVSPELQAAAAAGAEASVPAERALGVGMGVLIAGDPALGVIRWQGRQYVLSSEAAIEAFFQAPAFYARRAVELALQHLELVHLLQLLSPLPPFPGFCDASIPALLQYDGDVAAAAAAVRQTLLGGRGLDESTAGAQAGGIDPATGARLSRNGRKLVDASVETPVHFVDRHIDHKYEWNEWALRRRAIAMINLRKCSTTSAQTDASHFRRDNDAQVYLPKAAGTQTGIGVGTNTTIVRAHHAGLRGVPEASVDAANVARGLPPPSAAATAKAEEETKKMPYPRAPGSTAHDLTIIAQAKPPSVSVTTHRPKTRDVLAGSGNQANVNGTPPVAVSLVTLKLDI